MTFSRANALGWALYELLTSTQMNTVDINQSRALDGYAGGTYNSSGLLTYNNQFAISTIPVSGDALTVNAGGTDKGIDIGVSAGIGVDVAVGTGTGVLVTGGTTGISVTGTTSVGVSVTSPTLGNAIYAQNNSALSKTVYFDNLGGDCLYAESAGGTAVEAVSTTSNSNAIEATGFGTGSGLASQGGSSGPGIVSYGGGATPSLPTTNPYGGVFEGSGVYPGIVAKGGATDANGGSFTAQGGGYGVYGIGGDGTDPVNDGVGVFGEGQTGNATGVYGKPNGTGDGVHGATTGSGSGVLGTTTGNGYGVKGETTGDGAAVRGVATTGDGSGIVGLYGLPSIIEIKTGVYGETTSSSGYGVYGKGSSTGGTAVRGDASGSGGIGVLGYATGSGAAISGQNTGTGNGGNFSSAAAYAPIRITLNDSGSTAVIPTLGDIWFDLATNTLNVRRDGSTTVSVALS